MNPTDDAAAFRDTTHAAAQAAVDSHRDTLTALSRALHAHPETAFEEHHAARACVDLLNGHGFVTTLGVGGLPTAFHATYGDGPTRVAFVCEYDALPDLGHACGHNLIAMAGIAAALGAAAVADECGLTVRVIGAPAEERGAGKALLLDAGVFDALDAAMMVHPCPFDLDDFRSFALGTLDVTFRGRSAHACLNPYEGRNAADALTVAQVAVGLLRATLPDGMSVHGHATAAGTSTNTVADLAGASFEVRAPDAQRLTELRERVEACFSGAAVATGCDVELTRPEPDYLDMSSDSRLLAAWRRNSAILGRTGGPPREPFAITDMGNVSHRVPSIHPVIDISGGRCAPHEPEFADAAATEEAEERFLTAAVALAWTAIDLALET